MPRSSITVSVVTRRRGAFGLLVVVLALGFVMFRLASVLTQGPFVPIWQTNAPTVYAISMPPL
jgi:hypothetical protein